MITLNKLVLLMTYTTFAATLLLGYFLFWPIHLTEILNDPYPVWPEQVTAGSAIHYEAHFEKFIDYKVKTTKTIICDNGNYRSLQSHVTQAPIGEHTIPGTTLIPADMPPGRCYVQFNSQAQINPIRVEDIDSRTEWFTVVK